MASSSDDDVVIQEQVNVLDSCVADLVQQDSSSHQEFNNMWGTSILSTQPRQYFESLQFSPNSGTGLDMLWSTKNRTDHKKRLEQLHSSSMRVPKLSDATWKRVECDFSASARAKVLHWTMVMTKTLFGT